MLLTLALIKIACANKHFPNVSSKGGEKTYYIQFNIDFLQLKSKSIFGEAHWNKFACWNSSFLALLCSYFALLDQELL
jgi:hypothetical protein